MRLERLATATLVVAACSCSDPDGPADPTTTSTSGTTAPATTDLPVTSTGTGLPAPATTTTEGPPVSACDLEYGGRPAGARWRRCVVVLEGSSARAHAVDLDGDGRDELFVDDSGALGGPGLFSLTDEGITGGALRVGSAGHYSHCELRYDFDQDGTVDLDCLKTGSNTPDVWQNLGSTLGERLPQLGFPPRLTTSGAALLVDPDQDGRPERMITIAWPPELGGFRLFREDAGELVPEGPAVFLGGCSIPDGVAHGDFDGDGLDDAVVLDNPIGCDPHPAAYDPDWHRVHAFLSRPPLAMELTASVPTGAIPTHEFGQIFAADVIGDADVDIALSLEPPSGLFALVAGQGDGTFAPAVVLTASELGLPEGTRGSFIGQLDADPQPELVAVTYPDRGWILDDASHGHAVLEELTINGNIKAVGDFDGDGIGDLVVSSTIETSELVLLLSTP